MNQQQPDAQNRRSPLGERRGHEIDVDASAAGCWNRTEAARLNAAPDDCFPRPDVR